MKGLYKNKYRIVSARHPKWDYGTDAAYFVTICTHNRIHFFGDINEGRMQLSPIGEYANHCWYEIPVHFPFVELGAFVVMPNHIHGIIIINKNKTDFNNGGSVETQNYASLPSIQPKSSSEIPSSKIPTWENQSNSQKNKFGPQSKNLASIIRGYKIGVTKSAKKINSNWRWQGRYHDHIIRNTESFKRITDYIINNPKNWKEDSFYRK